MGSIIIRKNKENGFTEFWDDGTQDEIDDWLEKEFGTKTRNLDDTKQSKLIYTTIIVNKPLFNRGYNKVKKYHYLTNEPKREMTIHEYLYHLNFGLGTPFDSDNPPYPSFVKQPATKPKPKGFGWERIIFNHKSR